MKMLYCFTWKCCIALHENVVLLYRKTLYCFTGKRCIALHENVVLLYMKTLYRPCFSIPIRSLWDLWLAVGKSSAHPHTIVNFLEKVLGLRSNNSSRLFCIVISIALFCSIATLPAYCQVDSNTILLKGGVFVQTIRPRFSDPPKGDITS